MLICLSALPLQSHPTRNVHHALGNCFFRRPWSLTTSQDWGPLSSCLFSKALTRTNTPRSTRTGERPCVGLRSGLKICWADIKLFQLHNGAGRMRTGLRERGKNPGGGTCSGPAQSGAYSRDHSALVSSSALQRLGGEALWNHTITANITTLSKHNWADLDRWEREEEGMEFHCWYKERREHIVLASVCWKHRRHSNILTYRCKL